MTRRSDSEEPEPINTPTNDIAYPLILLIPGILAFAAAVLFAVLDWRRTGSLATVWQVVSIPLGLVAFAVVWYLMGVLGTTMPYWFRASFAALLLGVGFGYAFAYLVTSTVNQASKHSLRSYFGFVGRLAYIAFCLWFFYVIFIGILMNGLFGEGKHSLSTDLGWLSAIVGWAMTPLFLRCRFSHFAATAANTRVIDCPPG